MMAMVTSTAARAARRCPGRPEIRSAPSMRAASNNSSGNERRTPQDEDGQHLTGGDVRENERPQGVHQAEF